MEVPGCFDTRSGRLERQTYCAVPIEEGSVFLTWPDGGSAFAPTTLYTATEECRGAFLTAVDALTSSAENASRSLLLFREGRGVNNPYSVGGSWPCKVLGRTIVFFVKRDATGFGVFLCAKAY
jgi:hypothetical protein